MINMILLSLTRLMFSLIYKVVRIYRNNTLDYLNLSLQELQWVFSLILFRTILV